MVVEAKVLLVTDAVVLPATPVLWALKTFEDKVASGKKLALVTQATDLSEKLGTESSSAEVLVSLAETPGRHTTAWLAEASRILRPGGTLIIQEPICRTQNPPPELNPGCWKSGAIHTEANLQMNLLLAGFMHLTTCEAVDGVGSSAIFSQEGLESSLSVDGSALQPLLIKAQKPEWETGSSFTLKKPAYITEEILRRDAQVVCSSADGTDIAQHILDANADETTSFQIPLSEIKADELVDEDALLTEEDLAKPLPMPDGDDCEVGKSGRKACKNCTCGRSELKEKGSLTAEQLQNPQSACGNCGLGDAFRCSGCPYRGLPRFKLGEKISLPGALLTADM